MGSEAGQVEPDQAGHLVTVTSGRWTAPPRTRFHIAQEKIPHERPNKSRSASDVPQLLDLPLLIQEHLWANATLSGVSDGRTGGVLT